MTRCIVIPTLAATVLALGCASPGAEPKAIFSSALNSVEDILTRDGVAVPMLPVGAEKRTCLSASACFVAIDLFSYDNHPVAFPGDQLYCATGFGVVGGKVLGPGSRCEEDARL